MDRKSYEVQLSFLKLRGAAFFISSQIDHYIVRNKENMQYSEKLIAELYTQCIQIVTFKSEYSYV